MGGNAAAAANAPLHCLPMVDWTGTIVLAVQALFAVIAIDQLRRHVFPALHLLRARALITDVWAPLAIILPMLFFLARTDQGSVRGAAWIGLGGPIVAALIGLAGALIVNRPGFASINLNAIAVWTGAGLVLLLLGAAHHLTLWVGQCSFALAAVFLWVNTPDEVDDASQISAPQFRAGLGMMVALVAGACQGATSIFVPEHMVVISATIAVASAVMLMTAAARFAGSDAGLRIAGWTIAYGVLLALGVLSLLRLIPAAYQAAAQGVAPPIQRIAHGFGAYWVEATLALSHGVAAVTLMRLPRAFKRIIGIILIAAAAILAAWRLSQV